MPNERSVYDILLEDFIKPDPKDLLKDKLVELAKLINQILKMLN